MIKVGFPNKLFVIVDHNTVNGYFSFQFWYMDQRSDGVDAIEIGPDGYVLETIVESNKDQIIWVYIVGGVAVLVIIIIFCVVCRRVKKQ